MVYLTSDTHGAFDIHKINPREFIPGQTMTEQDYLVICGDFGCVWDGGSSDRFWMNWFESLPWTTVFIDGNHENFDVLNSFPVVDWKGGKAAQIRKNVFHLLRGEVYDFAGKNWLALGGGFSHDVEFRKQGVNWWNEEIFSKEEAEHTRKILDERNWKVDVVLSHEVPAAHSLSTKYPVSLDAYSDDRINQIDFLEEIRQKLDYKVWFSGHYHLDCVEILDSRPHINLFDTVEEVDQLIEQVDKLIEQENQSNQ